MGQSAPMLCIFQCGGSGHKLYSSKALHFSQIIGYGDRIELFEVVEDRPEGALYQIIFHEEAEEKKLPLTAVIKKGDILKFWAGKTVDTSVYEMFLNRLV